MKKSQKVRDIKNKRFVNTIIIVTLLLFYFTGGKYVGYYPYFDSYYSGGIYNIADIYESYSSWIDFFLFLLIFLGLGQSILGEHFKAQGGKAVFVGLGIFLAFALLLWEQQTGFSLVKNLGPYAFTVFLLLLGTLIYKWVHGASNNALVAGSVTYLLIVIALMATPTYYGFYDVSYQFPLFGLLFPVNGELPVLGVIIAVVFLLIGIFRGRT